MKSQQRMVDSDGRTAKESKRMSPLFAVFNSHVNNARARADKEFVALFGQKRFDECIKPYSGGLSIFDDKPTIYTMSWIVLVTTFVNEKRKA